MHMPRQRCSQGIKANKKLLVHFSGSYKYIPLHYCYLIILVVMCKNVSQWNTFHIHKAHHMNLSLETADRIVLFCLPLPSVFRPVCTLEQITNADLPCYSLLYNMCSFLGILTHWGRVTQICVYTHINNLNTLSPMC
jgi:hypothetical protein